MLMPKQSVKLEVKDKKRRPKFTGRLSYFYECCLQSASDGQRLFFENSSEAPGFILVV